MKFDVKTTTGARYTINDTSKRRAKERINLLLFAENYFFPQAQKEELVSIKPYTGKK